MSANENATSATAAPAFTERESQMLVWAMQSLKSGPPEIDYDKLAKLAGMSNPRSASNAWAKIKTKLVPAAADGEAAPGTPKPTPKRATGGKKKAAATNGEEGEPTPKKAATPRKRAAKKQDVDGEASPKKKGRAKKAAADDAKVQGEDEDLEPADNVPAQAEDADAEGDDMDEA